MKTMEIENNISSESASRRGLTPSVCSEFIDYDYSDPKHINRMPGTNPMEVTNEVQWNVRKALGCLLMLAEGAKKKPESRRKREWVFTSNAIRQLAEICPNFKPTSEKRYKILMAAIHPNVPDEVSLLASGTKACSAGDVPEVPQAQELAPSACSHYISSVVLPVQNDPDGTEYVMHPCRGKITKPEGGNRHRLEFRPLQDASSPLTADPKAHGLSSTHQSERDCQDKL